MSINQDNTKIINIFTLENRTPKYILKIESIDRRSRHFLKGEIIV